jgi:regulator of cell morphogenesis and NO signaling
MTTIYTGEESIGQIVSEHHAASNLLKEYRIDFCCGGDRALLDVLQQQQIEPTAFLKRLNMVVALAEQNDSGTDYRSLSLSGLTAHIVHRHHAYLKEELPVLGEFMSKIMRVHGPNHQELKELYHLYFDMKAELDEHLAAEEAGIFPYIDEYERSSSPRALEQAVQAIEVLETDHDKVGDILKLMRTITNDYALPPDACRTYTLAYQKLEQMESDLFEHIHLENNILFPRLLAAAKS